MEFFKKQTAIAFMRQRYIAFVFSALLFSAAILAIALNGLNLGLDFTGGTQLDISFPYAVSTQAIRNDLAKAGFTKAQVQAFNVRDMTIKVAEHKELSQDNLQKKLKAALPATATLGSLQYIGPQISSELATKGILAIVVSLLLIIAYVAIRFDWRFSISAAIALIHDPILILGIFAFLKIEFNQIVLAAVLTIIGYSLNDTIVVYDRVRENFRKMRKQTTIAVIDAAINQTLSRTIMTSGLTMLVVIALLLFGGPVLHGFSLALAIGIVVGTYSSIYIAGAAAVSMGLQRSHFLLNKKQ